jgi:hypothetical protein
MTNKCAQLFHKLSHSYMFRHCRVILRELVLNTLQVTQVFQMQLLVIQFTIKMFHIGFIQVHENCSNKMILANFIVCMTILMF